MENTFSVAPMMELTDRHCRAFMRLMTRRAVLYTEMVVAGSIIFGDRDRFLEFHPDEHPVALQLGGSDPDQLGECSRIAEGYGYDEINLNVGCPSDRVKNGQFGACLMAKPDLVAACVTAMRENTTLPVTVKTRLGIDNQDSYEELCHFIETVRAGGCDHFIVHARKAWLKGLSPKQNRSIPPLMYDRVYRLKQDYPDLTIVINGGVTSLDSAKQHLNLVDGVMMGREAYQNPWLLTQVDQEIFGEAPPVALSREQVVAQFMEYIEEQLSKGVYLRHMTRHMLQLFHGQPGAKSWRRYLSEQGPRKGAGLEVIEHALKFVTATEIPPTVQHAQYEDAKLSLAS